MRRVRFPALALALCLLLSACSLSGEEASVSDTTFALDTTITITLYGTSDQAPIADAFAEIARLEALLSADAEGSDVWTVNEHAGGDAVTVSGETLHVIRRALEISALTDGAFDITVGPLVKLWNIRGGTGHVPTDAELSAALALVNYRDVIVSDGSVRLRRAGMRMDLGAIAKGYIADRVRALLEGEGVEHAILDLGGNVVTLGGHTDGTPFRVGIRDPAGGENDILAVVRETDMSVVSSGDYERWFEQDGVRYHHILDPATGAPARSGLSGVTILTENSETADALSTAVFVLGAEKGLRLVESLDGVECILVSADGTVAQSSGLEGLVELK